MGPDFSGYATKAGLKCADGRTIMPDAFKHMDGKTVPLVWQHGRSGPENVLGHAVLEARPDGVYAKGYFNDSPSGKNAKLLVGHGDISALSIYANKLVERAQQVFHGMIREVSLVLAGANPGARIDYVAVQHGDGEVIELEDEAVIFTGLPLTLEHSEDPVVPEVKEEKPVEETVEETSADEEIEHAEMTVQDVYDSMTEEQKNVVNYMVGAALQAAVDNNMMQSAESDNKEGSNEMTHNVFEQQSEEGSKVERYELTHEDVKGILADAARSGSLKDAVEGFALQHGIENLDVLFPDARNLTNTPQYNKRRTEWVAGILGSTTHTPFSRVKTIVADITQDEARARGYIKGDLKKEEWFGLTQRTTSPTTVYKKQNLDRDDVVDITDFDVIAWLKGEMRLMLDEEVARAALIGDGRDVSDRDKVKDPVGASDGTGIRSILHDHELFATTVNVNVDDANSSYNEVVDAILDGMEWFKGTGTPTFYTTIRTLNQFLKLKDTTGRRIYSTKADVAAALGVADIVTVEPMNEEADLLGIIVNLVDYNFGADKGGEVSLFDDFDIDYNQQKYLIETRISGALTKIKSALVIKKVASTDVLVAPTVPTFVESTGVITIPTKTGVVYKNAAGDTLSPGAQTALVAGHSLTVEAFPTTGYYFSTNAEDSWTFKRPAS